MAELKPLRIVDLSLLALVFVGVGWAAGHLYYEDLPSVPTLVGVPLLVLAAIEAVAGVFIRRRIAGGEVGSGLHDLDPLVIARTVVLAKASAIVGAVFAGGWLGLLAHLIQQYDRLTAARSDTPGTALGVVAGVLLVVAAVWLERACAVPPEQRDDGSRQ